MSVLRRYRLHGYMVETDRVLSGPIVTDDVPGPSDLTYAVVHDVAPAPANGEVMFVWAPPNAPSVRGVRGLDGVVVIDFGAHRFSVDPTLRHVVAATGAATGADPSGAPDLVDILFEGWVLATVMTLRGALVLHGSAVRSASTTIAFVGNSGMGKSTMTALLCADLDDADFITDDVMRVEQSRAVSTPSCPVTVHRGGRRIRLRPTASSLAERLSGDGLTTADGRSAPAPAQHGTGAVPLDVIFIPWPSRDTDRLTATWLDPRIAAVELLQYPRVYEWKDRRIISDSFAAHLSLCASVPVAHLAVPWGPPWSDELAHDVMRVASSRLLADQRP